MIDDDANSRLASLIRLYKKFVELDSRICCNTDAVDVELKKQQVEVKNDIFMQMKFFMNKDRVDYLKMLGPDVCMRLMWIYTTHKLTVGQEKQSEEFEQ